VSDWSSDVCCSDLGLARGGRNVTAGAAEGAAAVGVAGTGCHCTSSARALPAATVSTTTHPLKQEHLMVQALRGQARGMLPAPEARRRGGGSVAVLAGTLVSH